MACATILNGLAKDCVLSQGGIRKFVATPRENIKDLVLFQGEIMWIEIAHGARFATYEIPPETGSLVNTWYIDRAADIRYVESALSVFFPRMDTAKRVELDALAHSELAIIVEDNNGKWWYIGDERPCVLSGASGETGTAAADRNGYTFNFSTLSRVLPYGIPAEVVSRLNKDFNWDFNLDYTIYES